LRANPALQTLLGQRIQPGGALSTLPQSLQRLCAWDSPLTLLALAPDDGPLQNQVTQPRLGAAPVKLCSQVWALPTPADDAPRQFLCAIQERAMATGAPGTPSSLLASPHSPVVSPATTAPTATGITPSS